MVMMVRCEPDIYKLPLISTEFLVKLTLSHDSSSDLRPLATDSN